MFGSLRLYYLYMYIFISDRIRKNMPAVDSKTVPVVRSVLTTPLAERYPPRKHVTGTSPAGGHVNTEHSSKPKKLKKTQSMTKLFGTQGVRARHLPLPPTFDSWPPASHQQIAHALGHPPEPGLTELPLGLESPARPGFGLRLNPGENLRPCSCEYS